MERPILEPAPVVAQHGAVFRAVFEHQCQFRHVQRDLTGLLVLPHKSMAQMARCILNRADKTHLSRFLSEAPWREEAMNRCRIHLMLEQTKPHRRGRRESLLVLDDTLCEHVGSLLDYGDRHDNHREGPSPLAPNPVTSLYVSGPVRFPVGLRLYRRSEELTPWDAAVAKHFPDVKLPTQTTARNRLHTQVDPVLLQEPDCRARHAPCRTKIQLAIALVDEAIRGKVPFGVVGFDAWSLAEDWGRVLVRRRKAWISLLKTSRLLETASFQLRDVNGWAMKLPSPPLAVEELVPVIPAPASRAVTVGEQTYGCFTLTRRIPGLGQVRIVVSLARESLSGRPVVLVTNRVDWSAAKILSVYWQRWPTEPFDQDSQGQLGFNEYRLRRAEAMGKHGCLVFVASSLRPLTCLPAGPDRTKGLIHTMGDACRLQGRAVLQTLLWFVHEQLSDGATLDHVLAPIFVKQRGIVPA